MYRVLEELINITEEWNPTYSFILFSTGLITLSSIITSSLYCKNDEEKSIIRLAALEHSVGAISAELQQINSNLNMQTCEGKNIQRSVEFLRNDFDEIKSCIIESDESD